MANKQILELDTEYIVPRLLHKPNFKHSIGSWKLYLLHLNISLYIYIKAVDWNWVPQKMLSIGRSSKLHSPNSS